MSLGNFVDYAEFSDLLLKLSDLGEKSTGQRRCREVEWNGECDTRKCSNRASLEQVR